jgi:hypothetical protein
VPDVLFLAALVSAVQLAQQGPEPRLLGADLDGRTRELAWSDLPLADPRTQGLWIVRPQGIAAPARADAAEGARAEVALVGGDSLVARVLGGSDAALELELFGGVRVPLALEALRSLRFPERIPLDQRHALAPAAEGDRLYRRTGALDVLDGTLEGFSAEGVRFDSVLGSRTIPWGEVAALYLEVLGAKPAPAATTGVPVVLDFAGAAGGRLRGELVALERERCRLRLGGETELAIPLYALAELVVADGRLTFVSELVPRSETGRGAAFGDELGMTWPHHMDASVVGGPLTSGRAFRRGIGMHAPSVLTFALAPGYERLRGSIAIDDSALVNAPAARGSVVFRVRADGELLYESPLVRGGDAPLALPPLALAGKRELALEVDPAGDFAGDRANWLELVLIR